MTVSLKHFTKRLRGVIRATSFVVLTRDKGKEYNKDTYSTNRGNDLC